MVSFVSSLISPLWNVRQSTKLQNNTYAVHCSKLQQVAFGQFLESIWDVGGTSSIVNVMT